MNHDDYVRFNADKEHERQRQKAARAEQPRDRRDYGAFVSKARVQGTLDSWVTTGSKGRTGTGVQPDAEQREQVQND